MESDAKIQKQVRDHSPQPSPRMSVHWQQQGWRWDFGLECPRAVAPGSIGTTLALRGDLGCVATAWFLVLVIFRAPFARLSSILKLPDRLH